MRNLSAVTSKVWMSAMGVSLLLATAFATTASALQDAAVRTAQSVTRDTCAQENWTDPVPIRSKDGRLVYVERPSLVTDGALPLLLGAQVLRWETADRFIDPSRSRPPRTTQLQKQIGVLLNRDFTVSVFIGAPNGHERMIDPVSISIGSKGTAVFWGEAATADSGRALPDIIELWHAVLKDAKWGTPQRVIRADQVHWRAGKASVSFEHGVLSVIAPTSHRENDIIRDRLQVITLHDGKWQTSMLSTRSIPPSYSALRWLSKNNALAFFIGLFREDSKDWFGLRVSESADGGLTWSRPTTLKVMGADSIARTLHAFAADSSQTLVLWGRRVGMLPTIQSVEGTISSGEARAWRTAPSFTLAQPVADVAMFQRSPGVVFLVSKGLNESRIYLSELSGSEWRALEFPFAAHVAGGLVAGFVGDKSKIVSWTEIRNPRVQNGVPIGEPVTLISKSLKKCVP